MKKLTRSLALLGLSTHLAGMAQTPPTAQSLGRVEITGSSIKRIQDEGASPITVFKGEDLQRMGITSAEQLLTSISANGNGIDSMVTNQGGDFLNSTGGKMHNNGAASASLRGLGSQYTLVLLNGRRVSTHGLNGQSVDLNSIPMAAVERVEVLKDGASAIYGTDAIGGVMNFILKKSYKGFEATAFMDKTQAGGGNIARGSLLMGAGELSSDGFNVMANITLDTNDRLRGSQRDFHNGYQPSRGLAMDTTGSPFANIAAAGGTALASSYKIPGDSTSYNRANPLAFQGKCDTVANQVPYRGDITGFNNSNYACAYDYGKQWSLMQPVDRMNLVSKGSMALGSDHTLTAEVVASRTKSAVEYTPIQLTSGSYNYPANGPYYLNLATELPTYFKPSTNTDPTDTRKAFNASLPERIRWRCVECGPRQQDTTTDAYRVLLGLDGVLAGWDYKLGLSTANSKATTLLGDGNMLTDKLVAAMATGKINPFLKAGQTQTSEAMALIEGAKAKGMSLYGGEANVTQLDGTISSDIFNLPAGPVGFAVGYDIRSENYQFNESQSVQPAINGVTAPAALDKVSRDIKAVFTELQVPVTKSIQLQLAARYDQYSDFGNTFNPKAAIRWQPAEAVMFRGSYSTGFHAPDFDPLYGGITTGQFNSDINDPLLCPTGGGGNGCGIRPEINTRGNPNLKPEKSKQFSLGVFLSPTPWLSGSIDFWQIDLTDRISTLSGQALIADYAKYTQYVVRDPATNEILSVDSPYLNLAGDRAQGVDINVTMNFKTDIGRWVTSLDGSLLDSYKSRYSDSDPWTERVGKFGDASFGWDLKPRWKHTASVTWSQADWAATVSQNYTAGYDAEVDGYGSGVTFPGTPTKVDSYTLYNVSATYTGMKNLTVTAGIKNILNTDPPFSAHNVDNVAGAGWDARVGDPRGRAYTLRVNYKFW